MVDIALEPIGLEKKNTIGSALITQGFVCHLLLNSVWLLRASYKITNQPVRETPLFHFPPLLFG